MDAGHGAPFAAPAAGERPGEPGPGGACRPGGPRGAVGSGGSARAVGGPADAVRPRHPRLRPVPPRAVPPPGGEEVDRQLAELIPSQMAALRVFVGLADQLRVPPAGGLAEQGRSASCDHGIKRWRLYLTQEQMGSVAYGLWLHRMTGSAAEANRFGREYGVVYSPASASGEGPPAADGAPSAAGAATVSTGRP
ncbi:DUF6417 family protein [Streptomyces mirabilis]|uniref:DUF6417 family protein n=1 Tax=Streptomyces mirabilis TaxID=68239 RepID=UPI0033AF4BE5